MPGLPSIYVNYNQDCTFALSVDGGITASPNATIPPGNYQLLVSMPNPGSGYSCGVPTFTFTGPGVNAQTMFAGQQLQATTVLPALAPSSTYIAEDANVPGATVHTITTAATGSSASLLPASTAASTGSNTQPDVVGSAVKHAPPELVVSLGPAGKPSLKLGGRLVTTLKAGRYELKPDTAARRAHIVFSGKGRKLTVTKAEEITFSAGRWTFSAGHAKPVAFRVQ